MTLFSYNLQANMHEKTMRFLHSNDNNYDVLRHCCLALTPIPEVFTELRLELTTLLQQDIQAGNARLIHEACEKQITIDNLEHANDDVNLRRDQIDRASFEQELKGEWLRATGIVEKKRLKNEQIILKDRKLREIERLILQKLTIHSSQPNSDKPDHEVDNSETLRLQQDKNDLNSEIQTLKLEITALENREVVLRESIRVCELRIAQYTVRA